MFYIGCPLWGYKEWVGNFFPAHTPPSDFLRLYSRRLSAVEGNTVFYALPSASTVERWKQETPATFRICPKVSRSISHTASLEQGQDETLQLVERMKGLGTRLGPFFLQLPPAFGPVHLAQLEAFLTFWPPEVRLAVEVRHPAFYAEEHALALNSLLRRYKAGRVIMDTRPIRTGPAPEQQILQARERKPDLPVHITSTTDFAFVRYIGHPRMEINDPFLDTWAKQFAQWLRNGMTLFVFCHCPFEEHSPFLCRSLYQRTRQLLSPALLPALPWDDLEKNEEIEQGKLF